METFTLAFAIPSASCAAAIEKADSVLEAIAICDHFDQSTNSMIAGAQLV